MVIDLSGIFFSASCYKKEFGGENHCVYFSIVMGFHLQVGGGC